ncbi:hypothetical protein EPUL_005598 [Erysiphe pulchra]|uniref:Uncharacterized protein n=1 Tax=Erysiphe pulchra TaxID=225359 RepID=A0A2S4PSD4_9PEZI|nr:hypothetical protein EPUL_005598 [Erysiphe pulchra]
MVIPDIFTLGTYIKQFFEGSEREGMLHSQWNEKSLFSMITEYLEAPKNQGPSNLYRSEEIIYSKLVDSCKAHPATNIACSTTPIEDTSIEFINCAMEKNSKPYVLHLETSVIMKEPSSYENDTNFEKRDGGPHSWTTHYQFLKFQSCVYLPLLITDKAICIKIYQSIPKPQRQRIRGYRIECERTNALNHKEMLEECNQRFFDKAGAVMAKRMQ